MDKKILEEISIENLMNQVKAISQYERLSGSDEEWKAFLHQRDVLEKYGYTVRLEKHDAYISLPISSDLSINGVHFKSQTHSMSIDTGDDYIKGELYYLSDIDIKNGKFEWCKDKIVAFIGRPAYPLVSKIEKSGALGIIGMQYDPLREAIPSGAWGSPTRESEKLIPRIPIISVGEKDGEKIRVIIKKGSAIAEIKTKVDSGWRKIPSLTAEIKAPAPTENFVMFTGHMDSWYFGATDNGTVNSAQLEIARIVATHRDKIKHNFRIVNFSGHSHGRYAGSAWYFLNYWEELHRHCILNVNADTIGGKKAMDLTRSLIMPETKPVAVDIIKRQTRVQFKGIRCARVADQSFWPCGVSSAFASFSKQVHHKRTDGTDYLDKWNADLGWWWHTPQDTIDIIDPQNYLRDVKIFLEYIWTFLEQSVPPLHFEKTAEAIEKAIRNWADKAGDRFDLKRSIHLSEELTRISSLKNNKLGEGKLLAVGRILVPLYFTTGNIFHNDDALKYPEVPALMKIDDLLKTEEGSSQSYEIKTELMEKVNYVNDSLYRAIKLYE